MKRTAHAPSVQMTDVPRDSLGLNDDDEAALDDMDEDEHPDKRHTQRRSDKYVQKNGEHSDSEDEDPDEQSTRRRRNIQANFRNIMDVGANDSGVETGSAVGTPMQGSSVPDDVDEMNIDSVEQPVASPSPADGLANGSTVISTAQSPAHVPSAEDGDVEMEDADVNGDDASATNHIAPPEEESTITVQQQRTPPDSPPQSPQQEATPAEEQAPPPASTISHTAPPAAAEATEPAREPTPEVVTAPAAVVAPVEAASEVEPEPEAVIKPEPEDTNDDIAKAQAAEEGLIEREVANVEGEARTEQAAKAEEAEDGNGSIVANEAKD
jgi:histone deacetylase 1/2